MAKSDKAKTLTSDQKAAAASHFYDALLKPAYQALGASPMPKELWLKEAYGAALKYDPEGGQYSGSLWKGFRLGSLRGFSDLERLSSGALDLIGSTIKYNTSGADWYKWQQEHTHTGESMMDKLHTAALDVPVIGWMDRHIQNVANEDQFFVDAVPAQGLMENASSAVMEQALLLPLYRALGAVGGAAAAGVSEVIPQVKNLTAALNATATGRRTLPVLFAGVEGATTGALLTAPGEDWKREAWQSAIGFAVGHSVFSALGSGLGAAWKGVSNVAGRRTAKLGDVLEGAAKDAHETNLNELSLAKDGLRAASKGEEVDAYKKAYAEYASVTGVPGLKAMAEQALSFIRARAGKSTLEILREKQDLLEADRAKWNPVFNVLRVLQSLHKGELHTITEDEVKSLMKAHDKFISDSLTSLPETQAVKEAVKASTAQVAKTPAAQSQIQKKAEQLKAADAKTGMNKGKPDTFYTERAQQWYEEQNAKGAAQAAKSSSSLPVKEVEEIHSRREDVEDPILKSSKPRYGYGSKLFELEFEDPKDKAAYILSNKGESKGHKGILEWYSSRFKDSPSLHGDRVRNTIKEMAQKGNPKDGPLVIPSHASKEAASAEVSKASSSLPTRAELKAGAEKTKVRSQYEYGPRGEVTGYSMSAAKDFKIYAQKAAKAEGFGNLKDWFRDLSDADFKKDLEDWFYPHDLKEGGFFFEHEGNSDPGKNPNFLAFMYNYKDHMPKEMAEELKTRLTDQAKVALKLSGKVDEERLVRYYALQMWNHVDDFLGALPQHKGEFNLFRSTQSDLLNPTKYQKELIEEKMAEERKNFQFMYRKHPDVLGHTLEVYDKLAAERYKAMMTETSSVRDPDIKRAEKRQELNRKIGEMQTEGDLFEPWRF